MQILKIKITTGAFGERKGLEMMWSNIFGMIIADAGYVGKELREKVWKLNKHLFTAVKANMKKLMTEAQWQLLKMRQYVETVFSVLKLRLGIETTLPRSPLGYRAHCLWCLTSYYGSCRGDTYLLSFILEEGTLGNRHIKKGMLYKGLMKTVTVG